MTPEQIGALAGTIGIPGIFAVILLRWVLTKLNGKLDRLTEAVERNTEATHTLATRLKQRRSA